MLSQTLTDSYIRVASQTHAIIEAYLAPLYDLSVRLWVGLVFWRSGVEKAKDWDTTVLLFQEEYQLPILPPDVAAVLGMATEVSMPILLFVGFAARLASLPLIFLTCVIQFVLGASMPAYDSTEHFYWLFLLGSIVVRGPGKLSLDYVLAKRTGLTK